MNSRKKPQKGQYGYRNYHKKIQVCQVAFGAAMILIQLAARNFTDNEAARNILTVMAVLSVLPTANVASPLLASWKYKTPPKDFYQKICPHESEVSILYDLIVTSKEQIIPLDAVAVHPTGVYGYCSFQKLDGKKAENYLNQMFAGHRLTPHVKLIFQENVFFQRLNTLKPSSQWEDDGSVAYTEQLLKNLSM